MGNNHSRLEKLSAHRRDEAELNRLSPRVLNDRPPERGVGQLLEELVELTVSPGIVPDQQKKTLVQAGISSSNQDMLRWDQCRNLHVGSLLAYVGDNNLPVLGVVKWMENIPLPDLNRVGIEFTKPIGNSSGRFGEKFLFECRPCHGFITKINYLHANKRFRFDRNEFIAPSLLRADRLPGQVKLGDKVVWIRNLQHPPEVEKVIWLGEHANMPGEAGVEFANKIGFPGFGLSANRPGHARLVPVNQLELFKYYYPMQDDLADLIPSIQIPPGYF